MVAGTNFDDGKGNITAYFGYSRDEAVRWEDRDIRACPFGTRNGGTEFSCSGPGSQPRLTGYSRTGAGGFNLAVDETTGQLRNYNQATNAQFELKTQRVLGGFRGTVFEDFNYEVFGQYSKVDYSEFLTNDVSTLRVTLAIDELTLTPDSGDTRTTVREAVDGTIEVKELLSDGRL